MAGVRVSMPVHWRVAEVADHGSHGKGGLSAKAATLLGTEAALLEVLELDPGNPDAQAQLASIQLGRGQLSEAEAGFKRALATRGEGYTCPYEGLGLVYLRRGHVEAAKEHFEKAISINPDIEYKKFNGLARIYLQEGRVDEAFNVVHSSLHVGKISGGTAINIKARDCHFDWEIRHLPSDSFEALYARFDAYARELEAEMQVRSPGTGIVTEHITQTVPALADRDNAEAVALCKTLLGDKPNEAVAYTTEAGQFQGVGLPTVICGPGSIGQAHQPDEYVERDQLAACDQFMQALGTAMHQD